MTEFGFKPSEIDGTEYIFGTGGSEMQLPAKYSYKNFLPKVLDQGEDPICVPCSLSAYLNWYENLPTGSKKDNKVDYYEIYGIKTTRGEGMTFKEAFSYLRHHGVASKAGVLKIGHYAMVRGIFHLRNALVANGPCFGALPVYNMTDKFWNKMSGDRLLGYHAISIVGYDEDGFIIRNSWGSGFGDRGYTHIPDEECGKFIELWTVLD